MTYTVAVCTVKNSWCWTEELSETCRFYSKNKFEKLVHLFGFIIRIKHGCLDWKLWCLQDKNYMTFDEQWYRDMQHTADRFNVLFVVTLTLNIPSLARQCCLSSWGHRRTPWFFCNFLTVWCGRLLKLCFMGFWYYNSVIQALLASNILYLFISTEVSQ